MGVGHGGEGHGAASSVFGARGVRSAPGGETERNGVTGRRGWAMGTATQVNGTAPLRVTPPSREAGRIATRCCAWGGRETASSGGLGWVRPGAELWADVRAVLRPRARGRTAQGDCGRADAEPRRRTRAAGGAGKRAQVPPEPGKRARASPEEEQRAQVPLDPGQHRRASPELGLRAHVSSSAGRPPPPRRTRARPLAASAVPLGRRSAGVPPSAERERRERAAPGDRRVVAASGPPSERDLRRRRGLVATQGRSEVDGTPGDWSEGLISLSAPAPAGAAARSRPLRSARRQRRIDSGSRPSLQAWWSRRAKR